MTNYLLNIIQPDGPTPPPEFLDPIVERLNALNEEMDAKDIRVYAAGLLPPETATVVRVTDGETLLTDGPFTEGKEHIGGFSVIRAEDLDEALHWASRLSEAIGLPIEVRPMHG